ncbi:hypothetical protein HU200_027472 [Digitaria exilis]|uniref:WRKY domain-containing protein n=1 Tax=Digitaria exilis TaxID=1010633 RepID=A0A835EUN5_9POAL|nr:hypothetical protein HU200_027472 [Digitaria exilis]
MSRENFTLTPYHDGHLWRKYGQKWIKGRPFPRLYFKCSYYEDKKCMATKLVEQHNDNIPPLCKVTYMYEHTCNAAPVPTLDILVEAELPGASSDGMRMLRFDSHGNSCWMQEEQQHHQPMSWSPFQIMNFDSSNSQLQQQHQTFHFDARPRAPSFLITESLPESLSTDNKQDYIPTTWNSFRCAIEEHLLFNDHVDAPGIYILVTPSIPNCNSFQHS